MKSYNFFGSKYFLTWIFFIAVILRLALLLYERQAALLNFKKTEEFPLGYEFIRADSRMYIDFVLNYSEHGVWSSNLRYDIGLIRKTPGYSVFLALNYFLFGKKYFLWSSVLIQVILDSAVVFFIYFISRKIFSNPRITHICSLLYVFVPFTAFYAVCILPESLTCFFILASLYIYVCQYPNQTSKKYLITGILVGFSILLKPTAVFLLITLLVAHFVEFRRFLPFRIKKYLYVVSLILMPSVIMFGGWSLRNYKVYGESIIFEEFTTRKSPELRSLYYKAGEEWLMSFGQRMIPDELFHCIQTNGGFNSSLNTYQPKADLSGKFFLENTLKLPEWVVDFYTKDSLLKFFNSIYKIRDFRAKLRYSVHTPLISPQQISREDSVTNCFNRMTTTLIVKKPFRYLLAPLFNLKELVFHSNTANLIIFTVYPHSKYLSSFIFKGITFLIWNLFFIMFIGALIYYKKSFTFKTILFLFPILLILYHTMPFISGYVNHASQRYFILSNHFFYFYAGYILNYIITFFKPVKVN